MPVRRIEFATERFTELGPAMIDGYIQVTKSIIDLLKSLLSIEFHKKDDFFDVVVEPMYKDTNEIIDNYLEMILRAVSELDGLSRGGNASLVSIISKDRLHLLTKRMEVKSLVDEIILDKRYKHFKDFFKSIDRVFWAAEVETPPQKMSQSSYAVYILEEMAKGSYSKGVARERLLAAIHRIEAASISVAQTYARIRVQSKIRRLRVPRSSA
jgi:hypothetical protein